MERANKVLGWNVTLKGKMVLFITDNNNNAIPIELDASLLTSKMLMRRLSKITLKNAYNNKKAEIKIIESNYANYLSIFDYQEAE